MAWYMHVSYTPVLEARVVCCANALFDSVAPAPISRWPNSRADAYFVVDMRTQQATQNRFDPGYDAAAKCANARTMCDDQAQTMEK